MLRTPIILLLLLTAGLHPAQAQEQADTSGAVMTVPVPEEGVIYWRSGTTGGVRIHSRHVRRGGGAAAPPPAASATQADLEALLERLLQRLGPSERLEVVPSAAGPVVVIVSDRPGVAPDTVFVERLVAAAPIAARADTAEAERVQPDTLGMVPTAPRPVAPQPMPWADVPLTVQVERALLETGLFRSLRVQFAFDESALLPAAYPVLDAVADVLTRYPALRLEVAGHTDRVGGAVYNERLSRARAAAVRAYLVEQGIAPGRLAVQGYGEAQPLLEADTPTAHALNRRVEFVVIAQ